MAWKPSPWLLFSRMIPNIQFETIAGRAEWDSRNQQQRKKEFERSHHHGHATNPTVIVGAQNHQRERAKRWEKRQNCQQVRAGGQIWPGIVTSTSSGSRSSTRSPSMTAPSLTASQRPLRFGIGCGSAPR